MKSPFEGEFSPDNNLTQRTIAVASTAVINNNRITTPIKFQFHPPKDSTSFNVAQAHNNIISAMKMIDGTLKIITFDIKTIDSIGQFLTLKTTLLHSKTYRKTTNLQEYMFYIKLSHGSRNCLSNIFDTLVKNDGFLSHNKFKYHKEYSICFSTNINPKVTLREKNA